MVALPNRRSRTFCRQRPGGIKGLQQKVASAARSYLSNGNAAVDKDWEEF